MSDSAPSPDSNSGSTPALTPPTNPPSPPSDQSPPSPSDSSSSSPPPPPSSSSQEAPPPPSKSDGKAPPTPELSPPPPPDSSNQPPPDSGGSDRTSPPPPSSSDDQPSPPPPSSGKDDPPPPPSNPPSSSPPPTPPSPSSSPPSQSPPSPSGESTQPPPAPSFDPSSPPKPGPAPQQPAPPIREPPPPAEPDPLPTPAAPSPPKARPPPPSNSNSRASLAPPSHSGRPSNSSSSSSSGGGGMGGAAAGITVAVLVLAMAALLFVIVRIKRRKRSDRFMSLYQPPPSYSIRSEGYYNNHSGPYMNNSGPMRSGGSQRSYGHSSPQPGFSHGSYGSQRAGGYGFHSGGQDSVNIGSTKSWFSYEELMGITNGFARENMIGEGGFGCVYKGLLSDGKAVAIKQLKLGSGQGEREFKAEVEIISRVHHRHLVSLVGYCISDNQRLLVYEFVPNGTLEHHLFAKDRPPMEWTKRMKIAIGSAKGLAYLHEDCHPRIIHRDIKSANILLDNVFEAQVADFGLAKLSNDTHTHVSTRVMGTFGYLAPEYASSGKLTDRSDVFSFGVVLLELITGRKPVDANQPSGEESLVEWARPLLTKALETGDFHEIVDPRLENNFEKSEMCRMLETAAACVRHSAPKRPRMIQVVRALDSEGEMADLTNGVKYGQSTVFQSNQNPSDIQRFRRMAFGSGASEQFSPDHQHSRASGAGYSGEYAGGTHIQQWPGQSSGEYPKGSSESETRSIIRKPSSTAGSNRYHF